MLAIILFGAVSCLFRYSTGGSGMVTVTSVKLEMFYIIIKVDFCSPSRPLALYCHCVGGEFE